VQYVAEVHIVALVAKGDAPPEWGCDAAWAPGGKPNLKQCAAVFGTLYKIGDTTAPPVATLLDYFPDVANRDRPLPFKSLSLAKLVPSDKSYFTYYGSLVRQRFTWAARSEPANWAATTWPGPAHGVAAAHSC
jgi:Eukaryotic-type carbonic anhydrase